jgi:hypothetical protein
LQNHDIHGIRRYSFNCNCFVSSVILTCYFNILGRLDDKRMLKVKSSNESCQSPALSVDFYSVEDREMLLGYPIGYVQNTGEFSCLYSFLY